MDDVAGSFESRKVAVVACGTTMLQPGNDNKSSIAWTVRIFRRAKEGRKGGGVRTEIELDNEDRLTAITTAVKTPVRGVIVLAL